MKENENDDIIKDVLYNKDGTVDYVFDDAKLDEVIAPFMNETEQRLERCKKCAKPEETNNFMGLGIATLICPLYGFECSEVVQCVYVSDNTRYE